MARSRDLFVIGTRGSALALAQAHAIADMVKKVRPSLEVEIKTFTTTGDSITSVALSQIGGKGLFTKELEVALLNEEIDCCVHSMKDVPTILPDDLVIASMPRREDIRDVFISEKAQTLAELAPGSTVGTSSLRRQAQVRAMRPDLTIVDLRGNLDTRLRKVAEGQCDAAILAAAGMHRMGWRDKITSYLNPLEMLSAVGQGAIGVETRKDDLFTRTIVESFADQATMACVEVERMVMRELEGGCHVPLAAFARQLPTGQVRLDALVASCDGARVVKAYAEAPLQARELCAERVVAELRAQGAQEILDELA